MKKLVLAAVLIVASCHLSLAAEPKASADPPPTAPPPIMSRATSAEVIRNAIAAEAAKDQQRAKDAAARNAEKPK